jgi:hypothetical protein
MVLAFKDIFKFIKQNSDSREITIWACYMEVYNELINDLLDPNNSNLKLKEDPI